MRRHRLYKHSALLFFARIKRSDFIKYRLYFPKALGYRMYFDSGLIVDGEYHSSAV